jgi:hypothetical protein
MDEKVTWGNDETAVVARRRGSSEEEIRRSSVGLDTARQLLAESAVLSNTKSCEAGALVMSHKAVWSL